MSATLLCDDSFTLMEMESNLDSDSDSKPNGYIVLHGTRLLVFNVVSNSVLEGNNHTKTQLN